MKSLLNIYTSIFLLVLGATFSSCDQQMVEPLTPVTTSSAETNARISKFAAGNYIVQFHNDTTLQLNTNQDIELLANEIASGQLTITDIYNFDGFKGFTGYLNKKQAHNFYFDSRVLVIEADTPIGPMGKNNKKETDTQQLISI